MTALAAWEQDSGPSRLRPTTLSWKRGEASAAAAVGAPPGVVDQHVEPAVPLHDLRHQGGHGVGVAHVAEVVLAPATVVLGRARARDDDGSGSDEAPA